MANLTLYKDFYYINHTAFNSADTYILINPVGISANTYISGSTTVVENLIIQNESIGKYFVVLTPQLYSFDFIYELKWNVIYDLNSFNKILITKFRLQPQNINSSIDLEIVDTNYDFEIGSSSNGINIEIIGNI